MIKTNNKKAFTLVELMIVIAIIGILAVTILPSLTGAQGRARDTGRQANVRNAYTALVTFQGDNGYFPNSENISGQNGCFSNSAGGFVEGNDNNVDGELLGDMLSGGKGLTDPQNNRKSLPCEVANSLGYIAIKKDDVNGASFLVATNVENVGNANYDGQNLEGKSDNDESFTLEQASPCVLSGSGNTDNSNCGLIMAKKATLKAHEDASNEVKYTMYVKFYE